MEDMLSKLSETVGGNIPRLLFALGILIGAWLVAVIVAAVIKGALKRTTLDEKLFNWLGGGKAKVDSGHVISRTAYWLILLFGVVAFFSKLGMPMVADPIRGMLSKILESPDPDVILADTDRPVASADSQILDRARRWFNLAREAIDSRVPDAWILDLS